MNLACKIVAGLLFWYLSTFFLNGQAAPTASRMFNLKYQVGVAGTQVNTDFTPGNDRGIVIYGDLDITRNLGVEALFRNASFVTPTDFGINNYLVGPRVSFHRGRFTPYAKFLLGYGINNYQKGFYPSESSEHHRMYAFGGGIDLLATSHINVRLFDFEHQVWPGFRDHGLTPNSESIGVAYRF